MIWSVTSTAYTGSSSGRFVPRRIADQLADYVGIRTKNRGELRRQIVERQRRRDQQVEHRIAKQHECRRKPPPMAPARPMRGRNLADLARDEAQPTAMERFAERQRDIAAAVPAQLDDRSEEHTSELQS